MFAALSSYNPYIPWDTKIFEMGISLLRQSIGSAFSIGILIFLILTGIAVVARLVYYLAG